MTEIKRVVVIGAGGVGFWLSVALRRDRPDVELVVYDADDFQGGNGARRLPHVGNKATKKVEFLKGWVRMAMGDEPPLIVADKLRPGMATPEQFNDTLVVDASDMGLEDRRPLWDYLRASGAKMLRVSYDGNGIVVVSRGLPLGSKPGGGYSLVPTLAQSFWAGGVGAAAVEALLEGREVIDYQMELPTVVVAKAESGDEVARKYAAAYAARVGSWPNKSWEGSPEEEAMRKALGEV